jgi:hypothetical protein
MLDHSLYNYKLVTLPKDVKPEDESDYRPGIQTMALYVQSRRLMLNE